MDWKIHKFQQYGNINNINNKVAFCNSFQFLSTLLDSLLKNLGKNHFKYLSQEFDSDVLDLVNQKGFHP